MSTALEWAHPRWRGEDLEEGARVTVLDGSSPLARGGHVIVHDDREAVRLIPAGAGRTMISVAVICPPGAHPRWRGEDGAEDPGDAPGQGSSPLARGGLLSDLQADVSERLIPAGAGRTKAAASASQAAAAHPRWRGEDLSGVNITADWWGSSPLARGGRPGPFARSSFDRLIPAGAGRTELQEVDDRLAQGSSPLARGGRNQG